MSTTSASPPLDVYCFVLYPFLLDSGVVDSFPSGDYSSCTVLFLTMQLKTILGLHWRGVVVRRIVHSVAQPKQVARLLIHRWSGLVCDGYFFFSRAELMYVMVLYKLHFFKCLLGNLPVRQDPPLPLVPLIFQPLLL